MKYNGNFAVNLIAISIANYHLVMLNYFFNSQEKKEDRITSISSSDIPLNLMKSVPVEKPKTIQELFAENAGKKLVFDGFQRNIIVKWNTIDDDGKGYFSLTVKSNRKELSNWVLESYISGNRNNHIDFVMTNGETYKIKTNLDDSTQISIFQQGERCPLSNDWKWV